MVTVIIILIVIAGLQRVLPRFSVYRSVTTSMIFLGILLLGTISLLRLPQELFPPITYPQLTVATNYANAAPEEIETLITKIIEEAISTVKSIKKIHSVSKEGVSLVIADFDWGTDMNIAALNMREKIDMVKETLPRDAEEPVVLKFNPYARPVIILSVTGRRPPEELLQISKKIIKDKLEKIEGVASANVTGGREREIRVDVDMAQLKAAHTGLLTVVDAVKNANINYPAGTTKEKFYEYLLRTVGEYKSVKEIPETPVSLYDIDEEKRKEKEEGKRREGRRDTIIYKKRLILLKDVAKVTDTFKEPKSYSRYNGKNNIAISIQKQADANTIHTVKKIKEELIRIKDKIPENINIEIVYDESSFIKNSIQGVADAAWQGGIIVFLVLLLFLQNLTSSLIVTLSIPISIFATFSLMYFHKISVNMMSLGGLALGVGMLVDNAIVAVENIYRHIEMKTPRKEASVKGTGQVAGPIVASTLTTVAVFLPMTFLAGILGQIVKDLSFTIAFSLTASMFVALSLISLLASRWIRFRKKSFDFISPLIRINEFVLNAFMRHKAAGLAIVGLAFFFSLGLLKITERELMPKVDTGRFTIKANCPTGTKLEITDDIAKEIEGILLKQPETKRVISIAGSPERGPMEAAFQTRGPNQAEVTVSLKEKRKVSTAEFVNRIKGIIAVSLPRYADIEYIMQESMFASGGSTETSAPVVIKIHGHKIDILNKLAEDTTDRLKQIKGLYGIKTTIASPSPETRVKVNKDKASIYRINVKDIAQTALIAIKGLTASKFKEEGNEYDIFVRLSDKYRKNLKDIQGIMVYSPDGFSLPLKELAVLTRGRGPSEIRRFDQQRVIFITANLFGEGLKSVSKKIKKIISHMKKPEGYTIDLIGETEEAREAMLNMMFILLLAFTLVYMIMASQFESLWQPFIIMFTVPFSIIGVALAWIITGTSINAISILGLIILGGIVVNNAIVLIEYVNQMRAEGKPLISSAIDASKIRLRPILMTAMTTVLGLIPMAMAKGEGAELRSPLAITVMGGLILATTLTLWVIPVLYVITANFLKKFSGSK